MEMMQRNYESAIQKGLQEIEWYKVKLESEHQWNESLEESNRQLQDQINKLREITWKYY